MSKDYGIMVGCETALTWVENLSGVDEMIKERVLHRMRYEFDKDIPVKPRFNKGKYGPRYDSYSCGNCGTTISEAWHEYCPNCGFRIDKRR